ncbi:hypothetical protein [Dactylosporangium sp. CA-233914]|uniref:hypothetical protein n=1 Tax=Dactylosporangium sp. CA-233914 TaxID=3239934 RepID=UPI003D8AE930
MKRPELVRGSLTIAVAVALILTVTTASAAADPVGDVVGVGDNTTQDVMNGIGDAIGLGIVGSYNATNPASGAVRDAISPKAGCTMTRPNTIGDGITALRQSSGDSGVIAFPDQTDLPEPGCVDFARASILPSGNQSNTGKYVFIPFAEDGVTFASQHYGDATADNYNHLTYDAANAYSGPGQLQRLYRDGLPVTVGGTTYDPQCNATPCAGGATPIHLYLPAPQASYTFSIRGHWMTAMGMSGTLPTWVHDRAWTATTYGGTPVQENDGTVLQNDTYGIVPFSIGSWAGQRNGHNDRRHGAHLHSYVNIAVTPNATANPLTGNLPTVETGTLNLSFPALRHLVYNVVEWARVTSGNAKYDAQLYSVFGPGQGVCGKSAVILNHGFATVRPAVWGYSCGSITDSMRASFP